MSMQRIVQVAAFAVATSVTLPAFAAAPTNEGGEYTYTGSPADMRTENQTGDQIWNVPNPISVSWFYPGVGNGTVGPYWQIYRGATITWKNNDRVMKGNVVLENDNVWVGVEGYIGYTGPVKLCLRNSGSLTAKTCPIYIGRSYNNGTAGTATVFLEEPSRLTSITNNMIVGSTLPGAIWMDGGVLSITNATLHVGGSAAAAGYIRLNGGEISLRAETADNCHAAYIGRNGSYASVHVSGGTLGSRRSGVPNNSFFCLGGDAGKAADMYVDGGVLNVWNERFDIGSWGSGTTGGRATLTVDGDALAIVHLPIMGRTGSGNRATVNLNGGRFELTRCFATYSNTGNRRGLNFDGGTLALVKHPRTTSNVGTLDSAAGDIVIYPRGGSIDVPSGIAGIVSTSFRAAEGYGVSEIALADPGSGYVTAPEVKITGGVGSNATAYAVLSKDRTLEKIVVTCRGEGYAANDAVTVMIESTTGSGAAATASLAPNAGGAIRKTGAGALRLSTSNNTFDGDVEIVEGALTPNGAGFTSVSSLRMYEGTILRPITGSTSAMNRLDVTNGVVQIRAEVTASGAATLTFGALSVNQGLALVTHTNVLALALTATDLTATSSAESPVVNGMVYANKDASAYRTPLPVKRQADGTLLPVTYDSAPGPDANWRPTADISAADAPVVDAVNSIILQLTPMVNVYVRNTGLIEVKSGMIVCQRPQQDTQRMSVTGGGAFTTRAKGGMFIYGDSYEVGKRSNSQANDKVVYNGNWRRLFGPFADPDASTPMALTVAGEKAGRPELGVQAWLLGVQTFSGGLNLVNGGVFVSSDVGFGASGSPIRASGYCSIAARDWAFNITHPIEMLDGSALIFSPTYGNQGNTVSGSLSGSGDLLTSDVNRSGYTMAFTGDHSAFTGDYYIQGHARIAPSVFSAQAGICLADGTNGVGVIETSGTFTRPVGTGKGEVCWKRFAAYPSDYGLRGGFAAQGGDLTVNLGGEGAKLTVGADYLPDGTVIQMQSQYADGTLTFMNGFELDGKTQRVRVWTDKTATFAGALSDAVGGGALVVTGNLALDGATLEVGAANLSAPMLTVNGALTLAGTLNLALGVTKEELAANGDVTLATATGGIGGTVVLAGNVPSNWTVLARANSLVLKKINGAMVIIR